MVIDSPALPVCQVVTKWFEVSLMVRTTVSVAVALLVPDWSLTVRVSVTRVSESTEETVMVGESASGSAMVMPEPSGADQEYVSTVPSSSSAAVAPDRVNVPPSGMVWSDPALTVGRAFSTAVTVMLRSLQLLSFSKTFGPEAVTFTVYVSVMLNEVMLSRFSPVISKLRSPPATMPYCGFWPPRNEFCADILPTTPGTSEYSIEAELSVMYQFPRF